MLKLSSGFQKETPFINENTFEIKSLSQVGTQKKKIVFHSKQAAEGAKEISRQENIASLSPFEINHGFSLMRGFKPEMEDPNPNETMVLLPRCFETTDDKQKKP